MLQSDRDATPCALADPLRVVSVIPSGNRSASMIFARRQTQSLTTAGTVNLDFYLATRTSPWGLWQEFRRFRKAIREFQPQLVHAHFGTVTALFCAIATRLPLVITFRGSDLNPCPSMKWVHSFLCRLFSHLAAIRARHIICVSMQLRKRLWWRRQRIDVIPTGVDTEAFRPMPRNSARHDLGWNTDDLVVLFNAGQTPAVKRLDLAKAAVKVSQQYDPKIRMVVLDGSTDPALLPAMMSAADCLLLTSDWEGSPTVVQEAMATNLPVVTVDVGDVRERLARVQPSAIVPRSAAAIGKAIATIVAPPQRSNGRDSAVKLSLKALAQQMVCIYRSVLGSRLAESTKRERSLVEHKYAA